MRQFAAGVFLRNEAIGLPVGHVDLAVPAIEEGWHTAAT
jgi:hypothetical protein